MIGTRRGSLHLTDRNEEGRPGWVEPPHFDQRHAVGGALGPLGRGLVSVNHVAQYARWIWLAPRVDGVDREGGFRHPAGDDQEGHDPALVGAPLWP